PEVPTIVYVTIATIGSLELKQEPIRVVDIDADDKITINDALYCAHKQCHERGVSGYALEETVYGLSLTMLWGDDCGSYGYYVNNKSAMSLADPVKEGDYVNAFAYKNADYSDVYCFFDVNSINATVGDEITLTLKAISYDANWNEITVPVQNATLMIGGEDSKYKTDANGKVTFKLELEGEIIVSAIGDEITLVPPVCVIYSDEAIDDDGKDDEPNGIPDAPDDPVTDTTTEKSEQSDETEKATAAEKATVSNNKDGQNSGESGCGGAISLSAVFVTALAGVMLIKRNKND
ncbi:MAG: hypothetical protein J6L85_00950, partial [Clostridia bacterium]|nr:hypothetical protein [Clostridia bacterium]